MHVSLYQSLIVPVCGLRRGHHRATLHTAVFTCSMCQPSLPAVADLFTTVWPEITQSICCFENDRANYSLSHQTLLSEDRQCCQSGRDAELGGRAVCALRIVWRLAVRVGVKSPSDTNGKDLVLVRRVVLLFFATPWHCRELSNKQYADHIQFKYFTDATTDASHHWPFTTKPIMPAVRFTTEVYYATDMMCLLLCACCLSLALLFWVTFSIVYYVIDSFPLFTH